MYLFKLVDPKNWAERPDSQPEFLIRDNNWDNRPIISNTLMHEIQLNTNGFIYHVLNEPPRAFLEYSNLCRLSELTSVCDSIRSNRLDNRLYDE